MDVVKLGEPNNFWSAPTYSVKVRGKRFLWGSAGLTTNMSFSKPFILHVENDVAGEPVTVGTRVATGTESDLGTLQPGECLSIPVNGISGVYAECTLDSVVHCLIY